MLEIERKFLVKNEDFKKEAYQSFHIKQGYLNSHPERTTRIRIKENKAFMTVKGKSSESGLSRFEWEKEIDLKDAEALLQLCEPGKIEKTRFLVKSGNHIFVNPKSADFYDARMRARTLDFWSLSTQ